MAVLIRPKPGPVNRALFGSAAFLTLSYATAPAGGNWEQYTFCAGCALAGIVLLARGAAGVVRDYRLRRNIAISQSVSSDHGSAREANAAEREAAGMNVPSDLLGLDRKGIAVWRPRRMPFSLVEMPPGVGKTISYVMPWIITRATGGYSLVIAEPHRSSLRHRRAARNARA